MPAAWVEPTTGGTPGKACGHPMSRPDALALWAEQMHAGSLPGLVLTVRGAFLQAERVEG